MSFFKFLVLLAAVAMVGCSGGRGGVSVEPSAAAPSEAKTLLEEMAESGEVGSAVMVIRESLEQLKQTDAAKADGLLSDLDELESMSDLEAVKAKAKEMADKL